MRRICLYLSVLFTAFSCIDRVELPIRAEAPRLVVEGQITNDPPPYTVRLTYTGRYDLEGQNPANQFVRNAQVSIADDAGRTTRLAATSEGGVYRTFDLSFRGQVGRSYTLTVVMPDGKRYVSVSEQMPAVPGIDSVSSRLIQTNSFLTPYQYTYSISTQDPPGVRNYYRWTAYGLTVKKSMGVPCSLGSPSICFDNCYTTETSTGVNVFSDDAINGNPIRNRAVFQLPVYAAWPQFVEVQQYGMTLRNYQFWKLYQQQGVRTGSIFDPLPAPVVGNVSNANDATDRARGYFAVTSVTRLRVRNNALEARQNTAVFGFLVSQPVPAGDCRDTYGRTTPVTLPPGWP